MNAQNYQDDEKWFRISLRFFGDNLPLGEIEAELSVSPTLIGRKGEYISANPKYAKHKTNIWVWSSFEESTVPFDVQIPKLLDHLESKQSELMKILSKPDVAGEIFLGFSSANGQGGTSFSNSLLKRITLLGLSLRLDLYPPSQREDETDDAGSGDD